MLRCIRLRALRVGLATTTALAFLPAGLSFATEWTAREIMQQVNDRDDGDNGVADLEMLLIDQRGHQRVRKIRSFRKDRGGDELTLMFFVSPADIRNTGFLTFDYDDTPRNHQHDSSSSSSNNSNNSNTSEEENKDDDQWIFLPALKKTKRIATGDKSGSFMGSDFSYADLSKRNLDHYDYTLMKETEVKGHKVWQIKAVPNSDLEILETGYTKTVSFVRQDNFVVVRSMGWLKKGGRIRYMEVRELAQIDGIWVATQMSMTTRQGKTTLHRTLLTSSNVAFNQNLNLGDFSVRRLEKGL